MKDRDSHATQDRQMFNIYAQIKQQEIRPFNEMKLRRNSFRNVSKLF